MEIFILDWVGSAKSKSMLNLAGINVIEEISNASLFGLINFHLTLRTERITYNNLLAKISESAAQPLSFGLDKNDISNRESVGMINILMGLLPKIVQCEVTGIVIERYATPSSIVFTPYTNILNLNISYDNIWNHSNDEHDLHGAILLQDKLSTEIPIYCYDYLSREVMSKLDLGLFIGYDLLSENPLIWLAIQRNKITVNGLVYYQGAALYPVTSDIQLDAISSLQEIVERYIQLGYYIHEINQINSDETLVKEIASQFDIKVMGQVSEYIFFKGENSSFLTKGINSILSESLPEFYLNGSWNDLDYTQDNIVKLRYLTELSYCQLAGRNPAYLTTLGEISILTDMTIVVRLGNKSDINSMRELLEKIILEKWNLIVYQRLSREQSIIHRIFLSRDLPESLPLVIKENNLFYVAGQGNINIRADFNTEEALSYIKKICHHLPVNLSDVKSCLELPMLIEDDNDLALRGIINISELPGLITYIPGLNVSGNVSSIVIDDVYLLEVEGIEITTLERKFNNAFELREIIDLLDLWLNRGDLFNPWGKSYYLHSGKYSVWSFRDIPELYELSGIQLVNFLRNI